MKQSDRRRTPRKPIELSATFSYLAGTWVSASGEAVTLGLSKGGALIRSSHALEVGEVLSLTASFDNSKRVVLEGHVTHVVQADGGYKVGGAFRNLLRKISP